MIPVDLVALDYEEWVRWPSTHFATHPDPAIRMLLANEQQEIHTSLLELIKKYA